MFNSKVLQVTGIELSTYSCEVSSLVLKHSKLFLVASGADVADVIIGKEVG